MGEIKSAFEKAMEKIEKLEKASPEELRRMEYVPKGNALAATYLWQEGYDLQGELAGYEDSIRRYLTEGAEETFLRNMALPQDDRTVEASKRAMEGIMTLKGKGKGLESIFEKIEHLFNYYQQARQQAYQQLRSNFEMQVQRAKPALEQQMNKGVDIGAELQLQFQTEWRKALAELDSQYEKALEEHKQEIKRIR
jgi:hypothetical protein